MKILKYFARDRKKKASTNKPFKRPKKRIIPRSEHGISRKQISEPALKVLYRLHRAGFEAYLVGGGVRDLLLGKTPKDFDIATDAEPEEVRKLFRNSRLIGRRFRLAHIQFGREIIEVATFRAAEISDEAGFRQSKQGMVLRDNVYGTIEEDAWRRDFTVNALYYNIADYSVVDFTDGMRDLRAGVMHIIGDADCRYREDPVRMLRAIRLSAKLDLTLERDTQAQIFKLSGLLREVAPARLFDEVMKLLLSGHAVASYQSLKAHNLFSALFPLTEASLTHGDTRFNEKLLQSTFKNTDERLAQGKTVNPAFMIAAMLWVPLQQEIARQLEQTGGHYYHAMEESGNIVFCQQVQRLAIPKRLSTISREIWQLQYRFKRLNKRRLQALARHPRFRAGFDFLLLRRDAGEEGLDETIKQLEKIAATIPASRGDDGQRRRPRRRRPARRHQDRPHDPNKA